MVEKKDSNISDANIQKSYFKNSRLNAIAKINQILEIDKRQKQNLHICYSLLSLRKLTEKLNDAGISISHVSLRTLLKEQGFFIYGQSERFKGNLSALETYIKHIQFSISSFHKSCNPVVFVDIRKIKCKKMHNQAKNSTRLADILIEWWEKFGCNNFPKISKVLIFIKGSSLKTNKRILKEFGNKTGLETTFYYIPTRIIKWLNIKSKNYCKAICIKQDDKKIYYNVSIYCIARPKGNPQHDFEAMRSLMVDTLGKRVTDYFSPPEWYYTLTPAGKKPSKECELDTDSEITKKLPAENLRPDKHNDISNEKLTNAILNILKQDSEFNKFQAFSYSTLSVSQILKRLTKKDISITCLQIVDILQNKISCVIYKNYKKLSNIERKQQFEYIKFLSIFLRKNVPVVFVDISKYSANSICSIGCNKETAGFLFACLKKWWEDKKHKSHFSGCPKMLIMTHGASLPIMQEIYQEFFNYSKKSLMVCHIPAGLVKVQVIEELSEEIKSSQHIVNIGVLDNMKVKNEDKPNSEIKKYTPPESWAYIFELIQEK